MTLKDASFASIWRETMRCFWNAVELNASWMRWGLECSADFGSTGHQSHIFDDGDVPPALSIAVQGHSKHYNVNPAIVHDSKESFEPRLLGDGAFPVEQAGANPEESAHGWEDSVSGFTDGLTDDG